jgi:hypothetical protein
MSLDVTLYGPAVDATCVCAECGNYHTVRRSEALFDANITHNLNRMAREAGIYEVVWRPEEIGITKAQQLIEPLTAAIALMRADPPRFEAYNSPNGWGLYEHFLPWLERYLRACREYPDAGVSVSR